MNKKIKFSIVVYAFLILLLVFFVVTGILVYGYESHNYLTKTALKVIPFPAAVINYTHFFSINDLENDLASVQRFYENQDFSSLGYRVDFQTADGQKRLKIKEKEILNKKIEDYIIENLAKARGIKIDDALVSQEVDRTLKENGDTVAAQDNLKKLYGWNIDQFKEKVVKPQMYQEKMVENFLNENNNLANAKNKIDLAAED